MRTRVRICALTLLLFTSACPIGDLTSATDAATESATPDAIAEAATDTSTTDASPDASQPTIKFVQITNDDFSSSGLVFGAAVADGDAVIVVVDNNTPGAAMLSDTAGNTYTTIVDSYASSAGGDWISVYVAFGMIGGIKTIKVELLDGGLGYIYYATEYSGITTFDDKAFGATTSTVTDALTTTEVNVTRSPELLFAYAEALQNLHSGTNFDARSVFDGNTIEDRIVSVLGNYAATATSFGGASDIVLVTFH